MRTLTRLAGVSVVIVMLVLAGCDRSAPTTTGADVTLIPPPSASVTGSAGGPAYPIGTTVSQAVTPVAPVSTPVAVAQAPATPAPSSPAPAQVQGFPYVVQIGDTLQSIAAKFNTTVEVLRAMNNLSSDQVTVGQQLVIAGTPPAPQNQPSAEATPTPRPTAPPARSTRTVRYVVKAGDRLYRIGLRYGVTWAVIARFNGIRNPNLIQPGDVLFIPIE